VSGKRKGAASLARSLTTHAPPSQELCNGGSLAALIDSGVLRSKHGGVRLLLALHLLLDVAKGVRHWHARGLAHGDLKPGNVLLMVRRG